MKSGQKVRIIRVEGTDDEYGFEVGQVYTVGTFDDDLEEWGLIPLIKGQVEYVFWPYQLEVVDED